MSSRLASRTPAPLLALAALFPLLQAPAPAAATARHATCDEIAGITVGQSERWRFFRSAMTATPNATDVLICHRDAAPVRRIRRIEVADTTYGGLSIERVVGDLALIHQRGRDSATPVLLDLHAGRSVALPASVGSEYNENTVDSTQLLLADGGLVGQSTLVQGLFPPSGQVDGVGPAGTVNGGDLTAVGRRGARVLIPGSTFQQQTLTKSVPGATDVAPSQGIRPSEAGVYFTDPSGAARRVRVTGPATGLPWKRDALAWEPRWFRAPARTPNVEDRAPAGAGGPVAPLVQRTITTHGAIDSATLLTPQPVGNTIQLVPVLQLAPSRRRATVIGFDDTHGRAPVVVARFRDAPSELRLRTVPYQGTGGVSALDVAVPAVAAQRGRAAVSPSSGSVAVSDGDTVRIWMQAWVDGRNRYSASTLPVRDAADLAFAPGRSQALYFTTPDRVVHRVTVG